MSSDEATKLSVRILGRDYSIACPPSERETLLASAEYLDKRMTAVQRRGKTQSVDRIAVMAALNISRDLLAMERDQERAGLNDGLDSQIDDDTGERLRQLQLRIQSELEHGG